MSAIGLGLFRGKIRAAIIRVAGFVGLRRSTENIALIAGRDIEQRSLRIVGWSHEVGCPQRSRTNRVPLERRRCFFLRDGTPFGILGIAPCNLAVSISRNQFPGCPINRIEEPVTVGLRDQVLAAGIDHYRHLCGVPVVFVMLGELEMPVHLSRVGIERE